MTKRRHGNKKTDKLDVGALAEEVNQSDYSSRMDLVASEGSNRSV